MWYVISDMWYGIWVRGVRRVGNPAQNPSEIASRSGTRRRVRNDIQED